MAKAEKETKTKAELYREERKKRIAKQQKKQKKITAASIKRKRIIRRTVVTVVAVVLIAAISVSAVFATGLPNRHLKAVSVGDHDVTVAEYNYYYYTMIQEFLAQFSSYASMGLFDPNKDFHEQDGKIFGGSGTLADLFHEQAISQLEMTTVLNDLAKEEGITLTDDDNTVIETYMAGLKNVLKENNSTIAKMFGKGATEDSIREALTKNTLARRYGTYKRSTYTYTDAELQKHYDDKSDNYDVVDYMSFDFPSQAANDADETEKKAALDDAKKLADAMLAKVTDAKSFASLAKENASDDNKEKYSDENATLKSNTRKDKITYAELQTWAFESSRKAMDKTVIDNGSGYTVVLMINPRYREEYKTVNVRHILIQPETAEGASATAEQMAAAKKKAEEILAGFSGTEDDFASLAAEKSTDTGSASNGGLYEDVAKGQMVDSFNDWCFDPARKVGDVGIVETEYGYHIMYFSGFGGIRWKTQAENDMIDEAYNNFYKEKSADYKITENKFGMYFAEK